MAVPLNFSPLNCATKLFPGLKSHSNSLFSSGAPNSTGEFHQTVHKNLQMRSRNKRERGRIWMMPIGTPLIQVMNPGGRSWQWVDLPNAFYRDRVVWIGQVIDEQFSNLTLCTLLYLDSLDSDERILLYINSQGGDLTPSLALYDTIQSLRSSVATYCLNSAGDMAGFILASGEKGKRVAAEYSVIAIRSPIGSARGRADDVQVEAKELFRIRDHLVTEFAKHTGQPVDKVYEDLCMDKSFSTDDAVEYGIIDRCMKSANRLKEKSKENKLKENIDDDPYLRIGPR